MNLIAFKDQGPVAGREDIIGRRWGIEVIWLGLGLQYYVRPRGSGWRLDMRSYYLSLRGRWRFGFSSVSYDGRHNCWDVGPISFYWYAP